MPVPQITITPAGFAAIINAEHTGTAPVKLTHVGLTPQHFDVATVAATLPGESKRLTTFGGQAVSGDTLHLNVRDDTADAYTLRGFGLYLQDGTLFAVYSQPAPIMEKAAAATMLLATDIRFAKVNATSIEVGDIDFVNPTATTTRAGVVRLSTDQEADAGSDAATAMTPRGLSRYINRRLGDGAPSEFVKGLLGLATAALFRTELGLKGAALRDEGHGNALNADLLDGSHGDYYLDWRNFTSVPSLFPPSPHSHAWDGITGKPATYPPAAHAHPEYLEKSGGKLTGPLEGTSAAFSSSLRCAGFSSFSGIFGTQTGVVARGYANGITRWLDVLEADGSLALYAYDTTGGQPSPIFNLKTAVAGGSNRADFNAPVTSTGTGASFSFTERDNSGLKWDWYATAGAARLWRSGAGDVLSCSASGNFLTAGAVDAGGQKAGIGRVRLTPAEASRTGFIEFYHGSGVRTAYIGYGTAGVMNFQLEQGYTSWAFTGIVSAAGGFDWGSSRKLKDIDGPLPYGLAEVRRITTLIGRYKPEYNADGRKRMFFDAEQFLEVMPEAVNAQGIDFGGEKVPSIKLEQVMPPAYRAIAELADLVDELRDQVAALKAVR
ncbi:hypothetical protein LQE85_01645 [Stenotrophomonas rhizophila]|uniref:hypothetical protein n=1 Tax=Stenotrophomonas rhizophila TaxID=216778 RepID=UPI00201CDCDB|nr:hypothetical protein [Stenotrophomonas rhizophila]UQY87968.1 hypothetical protein LQE85_01645 [Stenotrophomonas rhizophila]